MATATRAGLEEARRQIASVIRKLEAARKNLTTRKPRPRPQLTLIARRMAAFRLAMSLIQRELKTPKK